MSARMVPFRLWTRQATAFLSLVQRKRELSLDELRSMSAVHTVTATLECAGNRREELIAVKPIPGEVPWGANVIGTAKWRGVPLREVLRAVGVEADARYVAFTSLDEAQFEGEKVSYGSSIVLEKALSWFCSGALWTAPT